MTPSPSRHIPRSKFIQWGKEECRLEPRPASWFFSSLLSKSENLIRICSGSPRGELESSLPSGVTLCDCPGTTPRGLYLWTSVLSSRLKKQSQSLLTSASRHERPGARVCLDM